MTKTKQTIASVWIVFHLLAIAMLPNAASLLNSTFRGLVVPYANLIGFHSFWQFFSPDPGSAVFFRIREMRAGVQASMREYPPLKDPYWIRSQYNRRVSSVRFFSRPPGDGISKYFGPYLCAHEYPLADSLDISLVVMRPSTLEEVQSGVALNSLAHEQTQASEFVSCDRGPQS